MEWADEGIVLAVRTHGENAAIVSLLTREHGRTSGLIHGGTSKNSRGILQPGNHLKAWWRGRLSEQLGTYRVELLHPHAAHALEAPSCLAALASACALCEGALPERQPHPAAFAALSALLASLKSESWPSVYVHWELALLRDIGYGLDLTECAATGTSENLIYVSPRSGRAVSALAGEPYHTKLLALPSFLTQGGEGDRQAVFDGLVLSGFFLERHVHGGLPAARSRLVDRLRP